MCKRAKTLCMRHTAAYDPQLQIAKRWREPHKKMSVNYEMA